MNFSLQEVDPNMSPLRYSCSQVENSRCCDWKPSRWLARIATEASSLPEIKASEAATTQHGGVGEESAPTTEEGKKD